ncbi:hypothetical protein AVEN_127222-1 [Araneus ventricosus]|uniref:Uncharacterized protein n=1 Tax=Araneus ventricosus TaxID=182803 RepID=A0A4Y2AEY3_ARAVE|nr:hypothetical protein AVEN_222631-1 [Araneus ventricosus]GBN42786.1 hypothetical protein AVEN_127222-1 [Araneus ventricosus]
MRGLPFALFSHKNGLPTNSLRHRGKERYIIQSHKIQPRLRNPGELKRPHRIRPLEGLLRCRQRNPLCFDPFPMMRWERETRLVVGGCDQQPDKSLRLNFSATPHRG